MSAGSTEKMVINISFKKSEKDLYDEVKKIKNYGNLIKELLIKHFSEEQNTQNNDSEKMLVGIADICQLIESATKNLVISNVTPAVTTPVATAGNEIINDNTKAEEEGEYQLENQVDQYAFLTKNMGELDDFINIMEK